MVFLFALFLLTNSQCVQISCQDTFDPYSRCVEVTANIKVSGCPAGMYCPSYSSVSSYNQSLDFSDTYCEPNPYQNPVDLCTDPNFINTQSVGDDCCIDKNCISGLCQNLKCVGLGDGKSCAVSSACAPGYYCNLGICSPALKAGSMCTNDEECQIGYGCNNKYCVQLWSVLFTRAASDAKFCQSNYLYQDHCDLVSIRLNSTKTLSSPFKCKVVDQCTYYSSAYDLVIDSQSCLCSGFANDTSGYCGLYVNQVDGIQGLYMGLQYSKSSCSGPKAHSGDPYELWQCGSISNEAYENYINTIKRNSNWNLYQSGAIDKCAESINIFQTAWAVWVLVPSFFMLI